MTRLLPWARRLGLVFGSAALALLIAWLVHPEAAEKLVAHGIGHLATAWSLRILTLGTFHLTVENLVSAVVMLVVLRFLTKYVGGILREKVLDGTTLDEGQKFSVQRVVSYVLFAIGAVVMVQTLGLDLGSLAVFSGALGIGIGLGFQTIAKNFASGLVLLFEQPVKVGDRIRVGDLLGDIQKIGSRGTWVRTNDNVVMIVPNSEFLEGQVTNWTANDRSVRLSIPVGVSYDSDPAKVRELLTEVAKQNSDVLDDLSPHVAFTGLGDSSLDFVLRVWTSSRVTRPTVITSDLYFSIFKALGRARIEIPYPQRDLHIRSFPDGHTDASPANPSGEPAAGRGDSPLEEGR